MALHSDKSTKLAVHSTKKCDRPQCAACDKDFGRGSELNRHLKETHSYMRYSCPVLHCSFQTKRSGKVNAHMKKQHKNDQDGQLESSEPQIAVLAMGGTGSSPELQSSTSLPDNNTIATNNNTFGPHRHSFENTEGFNRAASSGTALASGQWIHQGDTERAQTPPQGLNSFQHDNYAHPNAETTSTEYPARNELLGGTAMLSLDKEPGFPTSWSAALHEDGWDLQNWSYDVVHN
ncbi:hypothetical protein ONS95_007550 [Cadophora gregata]|uniref:uncharacterized protein n=1 Tax=Cadophora gregata TaxID=51156 RepID=UPI0026DAF842|nr:uncharacterized protein ONS95_007550 [Cadophora gregata]KAK0118668.1 hypothetical protein ONS96_011755 [Cadophora gregata f. sp. sojae]KAK0125926.1 hypothetical protein ONS95_007550 [Cadophora gregata]